jgi:hypothetical protein
MALASSVNDGYDNRLTQVDSDVDEPGAERALLLGFLAIVLHGLLLVDCGKSAS